MTSSYTWLCNEQVLEGLLEEDESCLEVWYLLALAQYAGGAPDVAKETLEHVDDLLAKPGAIAHTDDPPDLLDLKVGLVCMNMYPFDQSIAAHREDQPGLLDLKIKIVIGGSDLDQISLTYK